ncbi:MAG: hypothetical protein AAF447_27925, partial [Myxococcota bacterium]
LRLRERSRTAAPQALADIRYWVGRARAESGRDPEGGVAMVEAALHTSIAEGYEGPAQNMRLWLAERR